MTTPKHRRSNHAVTTARKTSVPAYTFTGRIFDVDLEVAQLLGELVDDFVVVENGGEGAVHDLGRHGRIGEQQRRAKVGVLARVCNHDITLSL